MWVYSVHVIISEEMYYRANFHDTVKHFLDYPLFAALLS